MQNKRTETDMVRTKFWFSFSCIYTNQNSAFKLGRYIEPESYSRHPHGGTQQNNKFSNFKSGKHTPHPDLVNTMEILAPGSMYILNMPLWKTLQPKFDIKQRRSCVNQLSEAVISKVIGLNRFVVDGTFPRYKNSVGKHLARMGTYDALCILTIFWRFDSENMNHPNRMEIAVNIYHLLLILSGKLFYYGTCECFFLLYKRQVFDHARSNGYQFDVDYKTFSHYADILDRAYPFDKDLNIKTNKKRNTAIGMALQNSSKFFELYLILNNIFEYDETVLSPERNVTLKLIYEHLCAEWAFKVLYAKYQVSLIDTIKIYVLNNPNITELEEQNFIKKAKFSSMIRNI